jgi:hypothetical protein
MISKLLPGIAQTTVRAAVLWFGVAGVLTAAEEDPALTFNQDIRPILADHCFQCHGVDSAARKAGLRLDLRSEAVSERDGIIPISPGNPDGSEVIRRILSDDPDDVMPPPDHPFPLTDGQKAMLRRWVSEGAAYQQHWAFIPPERPPVPEVDANIRDRIETPVDAFVFSRLESVGLQPSPEASRSTLLRRLSFDLTGLPPTPEELQRFEKDTDSRAYGKEVERLLNSPRFGERLAMWWMDGARYADSHGFQADWERYQWPWRDWLISAFNRNQPFDEFTVDQLAGDLRENPTRDQILATGFHRNHRINTEGGSLNEEWLVENVMDRVETTGSVWLGLTLGCARCHDHKYDPISQKDFYSFFAYFYNVPEQGKGPGRAGNFQPVIQLPSKLQEQRLAELEKEIASLQSQNDALEKQLEARLAMIGDPAHRDSLTNLPEAVQEIIDVAPESRSPDQISALNAAVRHHFFPEAAELEKTLADRRKSLQGLRNAIPTAMVLGEMPEPRQAHVLIRGEYDRRGSPVEAALPEVFVHSMSQPVEATDRLGLARWIVSRENPLTARVQVNRLWEQFFGMAIVRSSENLGVQADFPTHPELLDWLAVEFMESGWDLKALVRTMVMSATYRQSAASDSTKSAVDPLNQWLSRGPRFRLQAEMIRDNALALSGLLVDRTGGPGVYPYQPDGIWSEFNFYGNLRNYRPAKDDGLYRRSLYTIWKRTAAPPAMTLFDMPNREVCVVRRPRTNTPLQALALMNDVTYVEAGRHLALRMMREAPGSVEEMIAHGFRLATSRFPNQDELTVLSRGYDRRLAEFQAAPDKADAFLAVGSSTLPTGVDKPSLAAMTTTAGILLNLDETITR